jgi:hypothetical protein
MAEHRLQRVAGAGPVVAIVEDQGDAALRDDPAGETSDDVERGRRAFGLDLAVADEAALDSRS